MSIQSAVCTSFKAELLDGIHQAADEYRIALYTKTADLGPSTEEYTAVGEASGTGYTAGGKALSGRSVVVDSGVVYVDWDDVTWAAPTRIVARGALIYNATRGNRAVAVLDFGGDVSSADGAYMVILPAPGPDSALIRLN